jgi:hypothetical protein
MRVLYAVALLTVLLWSPALSAADSSGVFSTPRVVPDGGGQAGGALTTLVTLGLNDPAMPCFNCVFGASQTNLGLTLPLTWVNGGTRVTVSVLVDNLNYTGPALFVYAIRQGGRDQMGQIVQRGQTPASVFPSTWVAWFRVDLLTTPGRYTLEGAFSAGGATSAVTVPLVIQ